MPQTTSGPQKGQKHLFVHAVRFWSMFAIVALHSFIIVDLQARERGYEPSFALESVLQLTKFATISFFLISGFLMGERLPEHGALTYFKRRLRNVGSPWLFWFSICCVTTMVRATYVQGHNLQTVLQHSGGLLYQIYLTLIYSSFWFVPNLLLALGCLLLLRRWIDSLWVGALFGSFTLFYSLNIYKAWLPTRHTAAMLGFVFFLWLGAWVSRHLQQFTAWLDAVPWAGLVAAVVVTFALALFEAHTLRPIAPEHLDEFNTIRLSNILFSVAVTLLLMRIPRRSWPRFIDVEKSTYGIYLVHLLNISIISGLRRALHVPTPRSGLALYANWLATLATAYLMSLAVVYLLSLTRTTRSLVGIRASKPKPQPTPALASFDPTFN